MRKHRGIKTLVITAIAFLIAGSMMIGAGLVKGGSISYLHIGKDNAKWWPFSFGVGVLSVFERDNDDSFVNLFDDDKESWTLSLQDTRHLEIDVDLGSIIVKKGETSQVRFVNLDQDHVSVKQEEGKQKVKVKHPNVWNIEVNGYIEVTLSEQDITLDVETDMGDIEISELRFEKLSVDCALGNIELNEVTTSDCDVDQNAGNVTMSGTFLNRTKVENDMGNIEIILSGKESEYRLKVDNDLGNTAIGDAHHNGHSKISQNNQAKHSLSVSNHLGNIDIQFR